MTTPAAPPVAAPAAAPSAPASGAPNQPPPSTPPPADDVLSRVSRGTPAPPPAPGDDPLNVEGFDRKEIDQITDPVARQVFDRLAKSLHAGYGKKFQAVADAKKQLPSAVQPWTVERVRQIMVDPQFQAAAKQVVGTGAPPANGRGGNADLTDEQWSVLTEDEKAQVNALKQGLSDTQNQLLTWRQEQEDRSLKDRYGENYDPAAISQLSDELISGRVIATREHLFKVMDYESAIERAYALGRTDERQGIQGKANGQPIGTGGANTPSGYEPPPRQKGQSGAAHFVELAKARLAQVGNRKPGT